MINSLFTGVSGLKAHQTKMDVIGNNVANVNTVGYKANRVVFKDILSKTLKKSDGSAGTGAQQVGLGVSIASITTDFSAGTSQSSTSAYYVSLSGAGFFMLHNDDGNTVYTRVGDFTLDTNGYLIQESTGYRVLDENGDEIQVTDATPVSISSDGTISYLDSSNNVQTYGTRIGVANFANPNGLEKLGSNLYAETAVSGAPLAYGTAMIAGENGTDKIVSNSLESSNVDLSVELTDMIVTQRGYQANSRVITTSDTLLEELVNLKR
ncbi:MAG: flagellar hook-basal body complex protein [Clostridia bacterium]|nr:flagellar hook-basal body complex protein [Clostridia bacterium]